MFLFWFFFNSIGEFVMVVMKNNKHRRQFYAKVSSQVLYCFIEIIIYLVVLVLLKVES